MAMFRFIRRLTAGSSAPMTDGPSRLAIMSAAGITILVSVFLFSA